MHTMHTMHKGDLKKGGRKYVAILVGYEVDFLEATLNGVQGVEGSNPFAPTKKGNDYGGLSIVISRHFCSFWSLTTRCLPHSFLGTLFLRVSP